MITWQDKRRKDIEYLCDHFFLLISHDIYGNQVSFSLDSRSPIIRWESPICPIIPYREEDFLTWEKILSLSYSGKSSSLYPSFLFVLYLVAFSVSLSLFLSYLLVSFSLYPPLYCIYLSILHFNGFLQLLILVISYHFLDLLSYFTPYHSYFWLISLLFHYLQLIACHMLYSC